MIGIGGITKLSKRGHRVFKQRDVVLFAQQQLKHRQRAVEQLELEPAGRFRPDARERVAERRCLGIEIFKTPGCLGTEVGCRIDVPEAVSLQVEGAAGLRDLEAAKGKATRDD
jgi:hypothetical protein